MLALTCLTALTCAPQEGSTAPVVINEFSYDDSGTDNREFVELFNATGSDVDIGGWLLEASDPAMPDNNADYAIPAGTTIPAGGFYVLGSADVPNVDQVVGATNLWENSNEAITLRDTDGEIVDTLVYEANKGIWNGAPIEGQGIWGNFVSIDGLETSWARLRDGYDTDNNGRDFRLVPSTPGASNDLPDITPYSDDFDAAAVGDTLADWGASFDLATVIDPTVADSRNPSAIPASPQGGNAAVFWDDSGGGNMNMLLSDAVGPVVFDAWVYLDATLPPSGEIEGWSVGVQGTTGTFYNLPDPSGAAGFTANGDTGVAWTFEKTDAGAVLYLVDNDDGGTDHTILGQIAIAAGVNDGWQRVRLHAGNGFAEGRFGDTTIHGAVQGALGGVYIGYREGLADNSTARPVTLDDVRVVSTCSDLTVEGNGMPGTDLALTLAEGASHAAALALLSPRTGELRIQLGPLGTLELGLGQPIIPIFLGRTDEDGNASRTLRIPPFNLPRSDVYGQGMTVDLEINRGGPPTLGFCTSDVEAFQIGAMSPSSR